MKKRLALIMATAMIASALSGTVAFASEADDTAAAAEETKDDACLLYTSGHADWNLNDWKQKEDHYEESARVFSYADNRGHLSYGKYGSWKMCIRDRVL